MPLLDSALIRRLFARAGTFSFVVVLLCVPGLTRAGQRIATSQAPTLSFSKSTECPPKKAAAVAAVIHIAVAFVGVIVPAPAARPQWTLDSPAPLSPVVFSPGPLRAPPVSRLA
ncbi:MAG TPA: hypothetical protein VHU82_01865 [Vicinamibacterales bacterium]|jgi:hypothetical protein|nr:hypothetical protein [Vicinamibacterales bacterium]